MNTGSGERGTKTTGLIIVVAILAIAAGLIVPEIGKRKAEKDISHKTPAFTIVRGSAGTKDARLFAFKFKPNQLSVYALKTSMAMEMDTRAPGENTKMKMSAEVRYNLGLKPGAKRNGDVTTLHVEPSHHEADWDISGPNEHIIARLRGRDVIGTRNGEKFMDTSKGIGLPQARQLTSGIAGIYLTGELYTDPSGNIVKIRGDPPFVEFWTKASEGQFGLFGLVFPRVPIATGDSWKAPLVLDKLGDFPLHKPGLHYTVTLTRQPDTTVDGRTISTFTTTAPLSGKNLVSYTTYQGKRLPLNIPTVTQTASGSACFDAEQGLVLNSRSDAAVALHATITAEGKTGTIDANIRAVTDLRLLSQ